MPNLFCRFYSHVSRKDNFLGAYCSNDRMTDEVIAKVLSLSGAPENQRETSSSRDVRDLRDLRD